VIVFLGGLGTTRLMWDAQLAALDDALALELPGHGDAPPPSGVVTVETIARDVLARAPDRFTFVGLSIGGMVGQWLGVHAPERVERLVLACTGAKLGERKDYDVRAQLVRREGMEVVVECAKERWFTPAFRETPRAQRILDAVRAVSREGYAACAEAVGAWDFRDELRGIAVPTLVVYGRDDPMTPAEVRASLDGFDSVEIAGAHLAPVESPDEFNHHLRSTA
jgi:3-oxoadipate enol-lactonase